MKIAFCLLIAACLALVGCQPQSTDTKPAPPATNAPAK
jgi:hypothetical protein